MKITKLLSIALLSSTAMMSQAGDQFKVAWTHYTGWEPWGYASDSGIVKKWADKYGIEIEVTLVNDYIESINLYTAGQFDAVTATNMDALTIPAVGGIDTTALIIGDFSNGNDGIVAKNAKSIKELVGREVRLVELSVSHYMFARALEMNGMKERDVIIVNQSDADIASVYLSDDNGAAVTWNPPLQQIRNSKGSKLLFDSAQIPGEIIDIMFVKTKADERLKKALTGAWYETMNIMKGHNNDSSKAISVMADLAGGTEGEFKAQLKTTNMFYTPSDAANFTISNELVKTMDKVRKFSFDKGLFGNDASSPNFVGIAFPNNKVLGNKKNIKLRFDDTYMKMAAENKL
jgi:NitT/TauT family transport system substrate-binding protein